MKRILKTDQEIFFHASTGHGAWEAAVANLFSPGDLVLVIETGYFSLGFKELAETLGLKVEMRRRRLAQGRSSSPSSPSASPTTRATRSRASSPSTTRPRPAWCCRWPKCAARSTQAKHPALLLSDTISSLGSMEYKMDAWGVDVTVAGSQKGLMMPTGLAITGVSKKAMEASRHSKMPKYYFNWALMAARMPQKFIGTVPVHSVLRPAANRSR